MEEKVKYISTVEASKKWGISDRRIRKMCSENKIEGVALVGKTYLIPADAQKPLDMRLKENRKGKAIC